MSDQRDAHLEPQPDDTDVGDEAAEPLARRSFIRRSAQVAAMSLFGIGALEPVIDRVVTRMGEMTGTERLAAAVSSSLRASGVIGVAHAYEDNKLCPPREAHTCNEATADPFAGCDYGPITTDFRCQWMTNFYCHADPAHFDCIDSFSCPPWADGRVRFDCSTDQPNPEFDCPQFTCSDSDDGYLCPGLGTFYRGCEDAEAQGLYKCSEDPGAFGACPIGPGKTQHNCPMDFKCVDGAAAVYICGPYQEEGQPPVAGADTFSCAGGSEHEFTCDETTVYDFNCTSSFLCGSGTGEESFECTSNHIFSCMGGSGFSCSATQFKCSAGGCRCNEGETGGYTLDDPGDFACMLGTEFLCGGDFTCNAADDFVCALGGGEFKCYGKFGCPSESHDGEFYCDLEGGFECWPKQGVSFQCGENTHSCTRDGRRFNIESGA